MNIITDFNLNDYVINNFKYKELCCQDCLKEGKGYFVHDDIFLARLRLLRFHLDTPMIPTSGTRCKKHNSIYSKYSKSYHITGQALDFFTPKQPMIITFRQLLYFDLFNGIGIYPQHNTPKLHIDIRQNRYYWIKWNNKNIPLF